MDLRRMCGWELDLVKMCRNGKKRITGLSMDTFISFQIQVTWVLSWELYNLRRRYTILAGVYLGELALRRDPGDGWLYVRMGSISADMDFVAPDAAALYVHSAFNNQYNISMEQFPISPFSSLGAVVGAPLSDTVEVKTGVYQLSRFRTMKPFADGVGISTETTAWLDFSGQCQFR